MRFKSKKINNRFETKSTGKRKRNSEKKIKLDENNKLQFFSLFFRKMNVLTRWKTCEGKKLTALQNYAKTGMDLINLKKKILDLKTQSVLPGRKRTKSSKKWPTELEKVNKCKEIKSILLFKKNWFKKVAPSFFFKSNLSIYLLLYKNLIIINFNSSGISSNHFIHRSEAEIRTTCNTEMNYNGLEQSIWSIKNLTRGFWIARNQPKFQKIISAGTKPA